MPSHNKNNQRASSPNSNTYEDTPAVYMPHPSRAGLQPSAAIHGISHAHFGSPFSGGYYANLDPQFHQTTPYFGEQMYYNSSHLVGTPGQQGDTQNQQSTFTLPNTQDFTNMDPVDLDSTTAMMQDAIAAVLGRVSPSGLYPQANPEQRDVAVYAYQDYPEAEDEASPVYVSPPIRHEQPTATYELQSQAPGQIYQTAVEGNAQTAQLTHNQQSFVARESVGPNHAVQATGSGVPQLHQYPVAGVTVQNDAVTHDAHDQLPSVPQGSVQPKRPVQATGGGFAQSHQPLATVAPVQDSPLIPELSILLSTHPADDKDHAKGTFMEFMLPRIVPTVEHDDESEKSWMTSFKTQAGRPQSRPRVAPPQPVHQAAPSQPIQQVVPSQPIQIDVQATIAASRPSLKRKARSDDENQDSTAKKVRAAGNAPGAQALLKEQPLARKTKYSALAGVINSMLPDYSQMTLSFSTRDAAVAAAARKRARDLEASFARRAKDTSIPQTDADRQEAVQTLFGAMKDISRAKDANSQAFNSRWAINAKRKYDDLEIETTCWEIVTLAERLHREGPSALDIRDPNYAKHIKSNAHLTFAQRIRVIATLVMEWKARSDGLIKGDTVQTVVAAPLEALQSAGNNSVANQSRKRKLKFANENQPELKKQAVRKRKGNQAELGPLDDETAEDFEAALNDGPPSDPTDGEEYL